MRVLIIGTGYVGLVTGACLAEAGHDVLCLDINAEKIASLKQGTIPIYEPLLKELVQKNLVDQKLQFTTCYKTGVAHAEIILIAVATPSGLDGTADLTYIQSAAVSIAEVMEKPRLIAIKSTVPPGTAEMLTKLIEETLASQGKSIKFDLISNPEFLREGCAVYDCMHPERIIIGSKNPTIQ